MNISLITLNTSGAKPAQDAADRLEELLSVYGTCDYHQCGTMQQVSSSLSYAFSGAELIVVGVEPPAYAKTKLAVLRAMHIKTELNPTVAQRLKEAPGVDGQRIAMHAAVPVGASVFLSGTGFCSGFATRSGNQIFLMLPLEKTVAEEMMKTDVASYLEENGIKKALADEPAPPIEPEQVKTLREMQKKVFFATTPPMVHFRELYGTGCEDVFVFDCYAAERNGESPKSYLADLARYSIPKGELNAFGAAVSNVFTGVSQSGEQRYNVYIALSDSYSSRVIRFLSQPEETPEELMVAAYEMLLQMIGEKCAEERQREQDGSSYEEDVPEFYEQETAGQQKARKKSGLAAVFFALLAVLIALAVAWFCLGVNNAKKNSAEAKRELTANAAALGDEEKEEETSDLFFAEEASSETVEAENETTTETA